MTKLKIGIKKENFMIPSVEEHALRFPIGNCERDTVTMDTAATIRLGTAREHWSKICCKIVHSLSSGIGDAAAGGIQSPKAGVTQGGDVELEYFGDIAVWSVPKT